MNKNIIRILLLSDVMTLFFMNIIKNGMTIHFYKNIINIFKEINFNNFILFLVINIVLSFTYMLLLAIVKSIDIKNFKLLNIIFSGLFFILNFYSILCLFNFLIVWNENFAISYKLRATSWNIFVFNFVTQRYKK